MARPKLIKIAVAAAVLAAIAAAAWFLTRPQPIEVSVAAVDEGLVEATVVNTRAGTVEACRRSKLALPAGGQISQMWVKEGDRVKRGQKLLELWNRDLSAQAELASRQVATAQQQQQQACILADNARLEAERMQALAAKGFVSTQRVDDARAQARAQQAACDAARADVRRAQSQISVARASLERTVLVAPFDGIVAQVTGEVGEFTTPSPPGIPTPPAVDLIDDSCLYVTAPMDEIDAPKIRPGMPARIAMDALPGRSFAGTVRRIAPYVTEVEKQARTVDVEVIFNNPDEVPRNLLAGYSADVEIILEARDKVLRLPTQAILEGNKVLVLEKDGRLGERAVTPGLANWAYTEIGKGLSKGERVVSSFESEAIKAGALAKARE
ncbi:efflux RND transporter periplasmic adaptor subunit [Betaproteobacteria bacterium SCN2]|nr:efflux RND transporter periplasmic adaptor subunit [Betaproteobacteria bacterium SCN2]